MPYSFVWLYLIKCVFTCSIFFDSNTKGFLNVLIFFGKYFFLTKTENFKNSVALFWWLSHGSEKLHAIIASSRVGFGDLFVSGRSSREKHLANFSKLLAWSVLAGETDDCLATYLSRENRVVCKKKLFFNTVLKKGLNFFFLHLVTIHFLVSLSIIQHHCGQLQNLPLFCHHFLNLQWKVWVLSSILYFSQLLPFSSWILCSLWYLYISWMCLGI